MSKFWATPPDAEWWDEPPSGWFEDSDYENETFGDIELLGCEQCGDAPLYYECPVCGRKPRANWRPDDA